MIRKSRGPVLGDKEHHGEVGTSGHQHPRWAQERGRTQEQWGSPPTSLSPCGGILGLILLHDVTSMLPHATPQRSLPQGRSTPVSLAGQILGPSAPEVPRTSSGAMLSPFLVQCSMGLLYFRACPHSSWHVAHGQVTEEDGPTHPRRWPLLWGQLRLQGSYGQPCFAAREPLRVHCLSWGDTVGVSGHIPQ